MTNEEWLIETKEFCIGFFMDREEQPLIEAVGVLRLNWQLIEAIGAPSWPDTLSDEEVEKFHSQEEGQVVIH